MPTFTTSLPKKAEIGEDEHNFAKEKGSASPAVDCSLDKESVEPKEM
ncbi:hypothetical protein M2451_004084 [Dysgonomonas sp. PFB1-18]|nr:MULTISPECIES: hypothetical protein [unclassified Dysgonomonas]MDH6310491.1 hypothetical protein [Dysgonomonas sp. PF1-14]MDH6340929.1 hypothetical protein [Dysgonomonas sp. PF1-16]MDH6382735.1 hypothetical protein [Dysgonomonas sp. PFB1-18]MDH6399876.1 hypothetical protein [Dysgonomonas sp. PF1-23]